MTDPISPDTIMPRVAVSAAIFRDDHVLLVKRRRAPAHGLWSLPGGHIEAGETALEAIHRELREETAIAARIADIGGVTDVIHRSDRRDVLFHRVIIVFFGEWLSGEPVAGDDAADAAWHEVDRLDALATTEGLAPTVKNAKMRLTAWRSDREYRQ